MHMDTWLNGSRGLVRLETGLLRRAVRNGAGHATPVRRS